MFCELWNSKYFKYVSQTCLYLFTEDASIALKLTSYILIGVGSFSMILGFLGCLGTIYEIRCLLGFVSHAHINAQA